ncbi:HupE/UreJ family protein [Rhizobium sp. CF122]|uniref:HupE/UreJ family protein n=1 Tax=Rhizobium sp. CF122 TaxID=1144312 RepID=UPI001FCC7D61|nr:HupE/UreJ family protein [Rhizobium sp. CF122]
MALSIVFLAQELAKGGSSFMRSCPWLVAFCFGLLHGLGFAGALAELGLPQGGIPLALFAFNIGVELGQLGFIAIVPTAGWCVRRGLGHVPTWTYSHSLIHNRRYGVVVDVRPHSLRLELIVSATCPWEALSRSRRLA